MSSIFVNNEQLAVHLVDHYVTQVKTTSLNITKLY